MTIDALRAICVAWPDVTEDIKWSSDLCFLVGGKMFAVVNLERPHQLSFKCAPEEFGELVERPGVRPAPYLARAMWVQEEALGGTLERSELGPLLKAAYDLVRAKLPRSALAKLTISTRPTGPARSTRPSAARRSRAVPVRAPRRRR
jgi:predicted DNA-binding protein (MmcQ/YjbR family)